MNTQILILAVIIVIAICLCWGSPKTEEYRVRARAYHSCSPRYCRDKPVTRDQLLIKNPFVWPYSGTTTPEVSLQPEETFTQEQDHDVLVN